MRLFLQVEFNHLHQGGGFGNHMLRYASSLATDIMGTDLDSQSEPIITSMVVRMIGQADQIFFLLHSNDPNHPPGSLQSVFDALVQSKDKVMHAVLCGDHRTSESMLQAFDHRFVKEADPEKIKALIRKFGGELPS